MPERAENRLLVDRDEVAPHEQADEIAIAPELAEPPVEPAPVRGDHGQREAVDVRCGQIAHSDRIHSIWGC